MNKYAIMGVLSWAGSLIILGFQGISTLMKTDDSGWESMALEDILYADQLEWIDELTNATLQGAADYLVTVPIYILLAVIGLIFFIISSFIKQY